MTDDIRGGPSFFSTKLLDFHILLTVWTRIPYYLDASLSPVSPCSKRLMASFRSSKVHC